MPQIRFDFNNPMLVTVSPNDSITHGAASVITSSNLYKHPMQHNRRVTSGHSCAAVEQPIGAPDDEVFPMEYIIASAYCKYMALPELERRDVI